MNTSYIQFYHFFTKKSFCQLQKYFLSFDDSSHIEELKEPLDNPEIIYKTVDPFSGTEDYKKLKFIKDFVYKELFKLADKQFLKFQQEITSKGIYSDDALNNFSKKYISKKREYSKKINSAKFLSEEISKKLTLELNKLEKLIEEYLASPSPNFKEKISFNWSSSEVLLFFHLLRKNKIIDWIEDRDLGRILEYSCNYLTDKEYSPIRNARKILGGFRRGERIPDKPLEKIKDDLSNENFFRLED
jgi:hypothetical protein